MATAGLNDISLAYFKQWTAINTLFGATSSVGAIGSLPALADGILAWTPVYGGAVGFNNKANQSTAGITTDKNTVKVTSATSGSEQAGKGVSYCIAKGNLALVKAKMQGYTLAKLKKMNDDQLAPSIKIINDTLSPYITSDAVISAKYFTAASLLVMTNDKTAYLGKLGTYAAAFGIINGAKKDLVIIQKPLMDTQIEFWEGFFPALRAGGFNDFVNAFEAIIKKYELIGKRNQGWEGEMRDSVTDELIGVGGLAALTNYPVVKVAKISKTNSMSEFGRMRLKVGIWKIKYTCAGYFPQYSTIKVTKRNITYTIVKMVAIPPPPTI
ncbi:MAG: hypothetical protein WCL14_11865 [Bacteroidota bacterium]